MTIREFQAWLAGLRENMGSIPTAAQWARVVEEVGKLEKTDARAVVLDEMTHGRNDGESVSRPYDAMQQALPPRELTDDEFAYRLLEDLIHEVMAKEKDDDE